MTITLKEKEQVLDKIKQYLSDNKMKISALNEEFNYCYNHFSMVLRRVQPLTDAKYKLMKAFLKKKKYI